jgi:hypothetical protein
VSAVLAAAAIRSDWNAGGSLLTFYFPIGLFIVVAACLYLVLTRPHTVPGQQPLRPLPEQNVTGAISGADPEDQGPEQGKGSG